MAVLHFISDSTLRIYTCWNKFLPTAYVERREGYVLTRVSPSVCLYPHWTWAGVPPAGGYPSRPWVPPIRPGWGGTPAGSNWGVPHLGYPCQTWVGVPHLGYPHQLWLGIPLLGGTPPWVPPIGPGQGGTPAGGTPTSGTPHQTWPGQVPQRGGTFPQVIDGVLNTPRSVCLLRLRRRTFLFKIIADLVGSLQFVSYSIQDLLDSTLKNKSSFCWIHQSRKWVKLSLHFPNRISFSWCCAHD